MADEKKKAFVDQLYKNLKDLFQPGGEQVMIMEFPGRVLDESTYQFKNDNSIYSNVLKPQVVVEDEFRLTDAMFKIDLTKPSDNGYIVGGPSGMKVSTEYEEALSTMIPRFDDFESLFSDRQKMRDWLLEEIEDEIDGKPFKGSRMSFYDALSNRYESARSDWEKERMEKFENAHKSKNPEALDEYAKWMAFNAAPKEGEIAALFDDLVVRGYYHEVRRILGYIDVASPGEVLEESKTKQRQAAMLSLDESETIYPIQLQPVNWAKSLSTNFKPVDLLLSPKNINDDLMTKLAKKASLERQIQQLKKQPTGDIEDLQEKVNKAQNAQDEATREMLKNFTEATFYAIRIAYNAYCKKNKKDPDDKATVNAITTDALNENNDESSNDQVFTDEDIAKFQKFQEQNIDNQINLDKANRELAYELEAHAQAEATDSSSALSLLEEELDQITLAINSLKQIALAGAKDVKPVANPSSLDSPLVGEFADVIIKTEAKQTSEQTSMNASSSFSKTSVSFLFGSYGSSASSESSNFNENYNASTIDMEIGMRVTKVTIDRGGWFNPEVLEASRNMYSTSSGKFNDNFSTYPVAFIIAKDVSILYKFKEEERKQYAQYAHEASESGGGFLCFGHSHGKSSTSHSKSAYVGETDEGVMIRIPGPQILMWILEKVPEDESTPYPKDKTVLPPGVVELLKTKEEKEKEKEKEKEEEGKNEVTTGVHDGGEDEDENENEVLMGAMDKTWSLKFEWWRGGDMRHDLNATENEHWNDWMNGIVEGTRQPNDRVPWDGNITKLKGHANVWECRLSKKNRIYYSLNTKDCICTVNAVGIHLKM